MTRENIDKRRHWLDKPAALKVRARAAEAVRKRRADFGALRIGRARRLIAADFASLTGDTMVYAAMAFAVLSLGGSEAQVAFALGAQGAGTAATLLFGGVVADRYPRRSVMVAADLLRFGSQGFIAALLLTGNADYWQLIVAQVIHGCGSGFYMPASGAIVPDSVPPQFEQPTNALKQAARSTASLGGPAIGAVAVHLAGAGLAIAADAVTFLASASLLVGLPAIRREREAQSMLAAMRDGWDEFRALPWLKTVTVQFTLVNALVIAPLYVYGPTAAGETGAGSASVNAWAALLVSMEAGGLVGSLVAVSWRPPRPLVAATLVFLLWGLPLALLVGHTPLGLLLFGGALAGSGAAVFTVLWETAVQDNTDEAARSRLTSYEYFGSLVGVPFGFALIGLVGGRIGADSNMAASFVFLVVAGLFVASRPSIRAVRRRDLPPDDPRPRPSALPELAAGVE